MSCARKYASNTQSIEMSYVSTCRSPLHFIAFEPALISLYTKCCAAQYTYGFVANSPFALSFCFPPRILHTVSRLRKHSSNTQSHSHAYVLLIMKQPSAYSFTCRRSRCIIHTCFQLRSSPFGLLPRSHHHTPLLKHIQIRLLGFRSGPLRCQRHLRKSIA